MRRVLVAWGRRAAATSPLEHRPRRQRRDDDDSQSAGTTLLREAVKGCRQVGCGVKVGEEAAARWG